MRKRRKSEREQDQGLGRGKRKRQESGFGGEGKVERLGSIDLGTWKWERTQPQGTTLCAGHTRWCLVPYGPYRKVVRRARACSGLWCLFWWRVSRDSSSGGGEVLEGPEGVKVSLQCIFSSFSESSDCYCTCSSVAEAFDSGQRKTKVGDED